VDVGTGSRALLGRGKPLAPGTEEGGTGAESPAGRYLAGVQYRVSSAWGLMAVQLAGRPCAAPELRSSAREMAAALAGVAVVALASDVPEALEESRRAVG
jgi:hypothetical protein